MVKQRSAGMRQVPWQSWAHWEWVAKEIFSDCTKRISAAQDRIQAWQSRGNVPIAVETTGVLTSIHLRDPHFNHDIPPEGGLPEEMLRMMYAMAVQRLVNGVVDVSAKRNVSSVATRADSAGLPRLLVDIRHETAHTELPGLPLLQSASKQALEWLKVHYWDQQRLTLGCAREELKAKLLEHCFLIIDILTPVSGPNDDEMEEHADGESEEERIRLVKEKRSLRHMHRHNLEIMKQKRTKLFKELLDLCLSSTSELVSILVDEGLLEQEVLTNLDEQDRRYMEKDDPNHRFDSAAATYTAWRYTICKLSNQLPRLPAMLLVAIVKRISSSSPITGRPIGVKGDEGGDNLALRSSTRSLMSSPRSVASADNLKEGKPFVLSPAGLNRLISFCAWLLENESSDAPCKPIIQEIVKSKTLGISSSLTVKADLNEELCRELLRSCLYISTERGPQVELVSLIALRVGNKKLEQQAAMLARFGCILREVPGIKHDSSANMDSGESPASEASLEGFNPEPFRGEKAFEGSAPGSDGSGPAEMSLTSCDLRYERVKRQQAELLSRLSSEREVRRRSVSAQDIRSGEALRTTVTQDRRATHGTNPGGKGNQESRWTLTDNWRPCALGMIPSPYHVVGIMPSLEISDKVEAVRLESGGETHSEQQQVLIVDDIVRNRESATNHVEVSAIKRKSEDDLSLEKRAKKSERHVQFSVPQEEKGKPTQSTGGNHSRLKTEQLPGGSLLQGCLRQHGTLAHVTPQQMESLAAAVHVL